MSAANIEAGLVAYFKADAVIAVMIGTRAFGGELPEDEAQYMPRQALVIRASGGVQINAESTVEHDTQRVDIFSFGPTPREAGRVARHVALAMRRLTRGVYGGVLIHWANPAGGSFAGREPVTEWPRHFQSFQVMHALNEVPS